MGLGGGGGPGRGFCITYTVTTVVGNTIYVFELDICYAGGTETKLRNG